MYCPHCGETAMYAGYDGKTLGFWHDKHGRRSCWMIIGEMVDNDPRTGADK